MALVSFDIDGALEIGELLPAGAAYAGPKGRALIDRELYLPHSWTGDQERLAAAKVPGKRSFTTKPQLLRAMIERAIAAEVPFAWVTADEAYGDNGPLRAFQEEHQLSYVLAVSRDHAIATKADTRRADTMAAALPRAAWQRVSCGNGAKSREECFQARRERGRAGPLPGPPLPRLVPVRHPPNARPGLLAVTRAALAGPAVPGQPLKITSSPLEY
jgi:hypothetical protein